MPWIRWPIARIDLCMKSVCKISLVLIASLAMSCRHTGIVDNASVKLARPEKSVPQLACTDLRNAFPEVLNCYRIQVVNDTVLVFQVQVCDDSPWHFKAYSTKTLNYIGSFGRNGRGPGEMLHPSIAIKSPSEKYLCVKDNSAGCSYLVDILESIESQSTVAEQSYVLPPGIIDWIPVSDHEQFILLSENNAMSFRLAGSEGDALKEFDLYKGHNEERYVTHLSSMLLHNENTGQVAEVMVFFPQINFISTADGQAYSVAVSKDYRNWRSVMNRMLGPETMEYYVGATSTADYIFAAYKACALGQDNGSNGTHIHIFDWNGNFLYDISVAENIDNLAYDSMNGFLYCKVRGDGVIVRYDLKM